MSILFCAGLKVTLYAVQLFDDIGRNNNYSLYERLGTHVAELMSIIYRVLPNLLESSFLELNVVRLLCTLC